MIRIAICDDEKNQVDLLLKYTKEYFLLKEFEVEKFSATSSDEFRALILNNIFDIVFLDIEIDEKSGIDLAKEIRAINKDTIIVFITGYDKYAKSAFDVKAFNYLTKPLLQVDFNIVMDEIIEELNERNFLKDNYYEKFIIQIKGEYKEIFYKDILWFQKVGKYIRVICYDYVIEYRDTLNSILEKLDSNIFIRCHEGYIVNINKVYGFLNMKLIICEGKGEIPVSRRRSKDVRDAISKKNWGGW